MGFEFWRQVANAEKGRPHVYYLGQAGYVIKSSSGELLGNDLYLSNACQENNPGRGCGSKRIQPMVLSPEDLAFDYLVATHVHTDHFDPLSMPGLMKPSSTRLLASYGCQEKVRELQIDENRVSYWKAGEAVECGDYRIHFIACDHGEGAPDAFGTIIEFDGLRILNTGDTSLHLDWVEMYRSFGHIDLMFAPNNGVWGNRNNEECMALALQVRPGLLVPNHFGMTAIHGGDPRAFWTMMSEHPEQNWTFLSIGEEVTFL